MPLYMVVGWLDVSLTKTRSNMVSSGGGAGYVHSRIAIEKTGGKVEYLKA